MGFTSGRTTRLSRMSGGKPCSVIMGGFISIQIWDCVLCRSCRTGLSLKAGCSFFIQIKIPDIFKPDANLRNHKSAWISHKPIFPESFQYRPAKSCVVIIIIIFLTCFPRVFHIVEHPLKCDYKETYFLHI